MRYYIGWSDGYCSGFVDYNEDFVSDNLYERGEFYDSEEEAEKAIQSLKERFPNCCYLFVGEIED